MPNRDEVQARYTAQAAYACGAGEVAALHFQCERGRIVVKLPIRLWRLLASALKDANGRAWPTYHETPDEAAIAASFIDKRPPVAPRGTVTGKLEAAWAEWLKNPSETLLSLGQRTELTPSSLSAHFLSRHSQAYRQLTKERPRSGARRSAEDQAKAQQAYKEFVGTGASVRDLAVKYDVSVNILYAEFRYLRREADLINRLPVLKPAGAIL